MRLLPNCVRHGSLTYNLYLRSWMTFVCVDRYVGTLIHENQQTCLLRQLSKVGAKGATENSTFIGATCVWKSLRLPPMSTCRVMYMRQLDLEQFVTPASR